MNCPDALAPPYLGTAPARCQFRGGAPEFARAPRRHCATYPWRRTPGRHRPGAQSALRAARRRGKRSLASSGPAGAKRRRGGRLEPLVRGAAVAKRAKKKTYSSHQVFGWHSYHVLAALTVMKAMCRWSLHKTERRASRRLSLALYLSRVRSSEVLDGTAPTSPRCNSRHGRFCCRASAWHAFRRRVSTQQ